jgi:eukaryotic-like serine/threonine-protein kinase
MPPVSEAARACLVGPDAVDDPSAPRRLAEIAVSRSPDAPWCQYVLGLAHFREGRNDRAVKSLTRSLELGDGWSGAPLNYPVLAMAHHRLGREDEARRSLERAHGRRVDAVDGVEPGGGLRATAPCWDRVEFWLLLREADAMVLDAAFPADPFAP